MAFHNIHNVEIHPLKYKLAAAAVLGKKTSPRLRNA